MPRGRNTLFRKSVFCGKRLWFAAATNRIQDFYAGIIQSQEDHSRRSVYHGVLTPTKRRPCIDAFPTAIRLSLSSIRPSIGTQNPVPEEMNHSEIAVGMPMMNEVQFLFAFEPCKPLKPRSLYMVFLVEKDVRAERCRACDDLNQEEI